MHALSVGARVREGWRTGTLVEVYELTSVRHHRLGKSAVVLFDGDKVPTRGVWLDELRAVPRVGEEGNPTGCRRGAWGGPGCLAHEGHEIGEDGHCIEGRTARPIGAVPK